MKKRINIQQLIFTFTFVAAMLCCLSSQAANRTWSGGANPIFNWNVSGNWDTLPVSGSDALIFAGSTGLLNTNDYSGATFLGITYNSGSGAFASYGNSLTLGGNIANNSTSLQTINFPVASTAVRTFTTTAGGGDITLNGAFTGTGGGGITKAGSGTLTLSGVNSFTGAFAANAGRVSITANSTTSSAGFNNIGNTASTGAAVSTSSGASLIWSGANGGNFAGQTSASGVLYNDGTFNITGTVLNSAGTYLGNANTTYGYIRNTGTAIVSGRVFLGAGSGALGMLDVAGGTFTVGGTNQNP